MSVTFDRYAKPDGSRKTEYGKYIEQDGKGGFEHIVRYDEGITSDHVMASGSLPINFDYASLEVDSHVPNHNIPQPKDEISSEMIRRETTKSLQTFYYQNEKRYFWDGGLMTNTPLTH